MYLCRKITKNITTMSKKKGGKRVNKKQLIEMLQTFFQEHPNEVFSFKQIFRALKLDTHPAKMLAIETMDEMAWDDYLTKASDNSYPARRWRKTHLCLRAQLYVCSEWRPCPCGDDGSPSESYQGGYGGRSVVA